MKRLTLIMVVALLMGSVVRGQSVYEAYAAPLEILINGDPAEGQVITAGTEITVTCRVVADANAYFPEDSSGTPEPSYEAQAQSSLRLLLGTNLLKRDDHDVSAEDVTLAEIAVDKTLSVTYKVQTQSAWYRIEAVSNAYAKYWDPSVQPDGAWRIEESSAESDTLTFEVVAQQQDTTPPVITLNGDAVMTLECGVDSYTEPGATAVDDVDGEVGVVIGGDVVNTEVCGTYVVTYDATDSSGNSAQVTRTVIVQDTTGPVITCPGDTTIEAMEPEGVAIDDDRIQAFLAGASATDNSDPSEDIVITNDAPPLFPPGDTTVTFTAEDTSGNTASCSSTVTVVEAAEASVRIIPRIINRDGRLPRILTVIRFSVGAAEEDIDIEQPILLFPGDSLEGIEATSQRIVSWSRNGTLRVSVFATFPKDEVTAGIPEDGQAEMMAIGRLTSGQYFCGFSTVRIISWSR